MSLVTALPPELVVHVARYVCSYAALDAMPEEPEQRTRPVVRLIAGFRGDAPDAEGLVDLREKATSGVFLRNIVCSVDPKELGIDLLSPLFACAAGG